MNAKIYKIIPKENGDNGDIYYGSTTHKWVCHRFTVHKNEFKRYNAKLEGTHRLTSFNLFEKYGVENCKIELVEQFEYENKKEILEKERFYIDNNECINRCTPGKTPQEYHKEWYEKNKDSQLEKNKEYRKTNIEKCKAQKSQDYNCDCGCIVSWGKQWEHKKSKKHLALLALKDPK